uniref:Gypsy retrotransposon integrase-like protein 1 n=1 Tax=Xenopus tropicalis TaxID=8364 RepID=A0A803JWE8_XENTR
HTGIVPETTLRPKKYLIANNKIFVPEDLRLEVLKFVHDHPVSGHLGVYKTQELAKRHFFWPGMMRDCAKYVTSCQTCARFKDSHSRPMGLLQPLPVPERPWERISMDFIVDLLKSAGFNTIMVVVDGLTKMAHFIPLSGLPSAATTAEVFIREIFRLHGLPKVVISDRGSQFTSRFWRSLCQGSLGIQTCFSTAFHPQTNRQTERTNQTLEQYLHCFVTSLQNDWVTFLPTAEFAYNNSVHSTTQMTPFFANTGIHPSLFPGMLSASSVPTVQERLTALHNLHTTLISTLKEANARSKRYADKCRSKEVAFEVGDKVWLSTKNLKLHVPSVKLGPKFVGPFVIMRKINEVAYRLELPDSLRVHPVFHVSLLKPCVKGQFSHPNLNSPASVLVNGEEEFAISEILDSRISQGHLQYLYIINEEESTIMQSHCFERLLFQTSAQFLIVIRKSFGC